MCVHTPLEYHQRSLQYADRAFLARKQGDLHNSQKWAKMAFLYEWESLYALTPSDQPTYNVLLQSLFTLACWSGDLHLLKSLPNSVNDLITCPMSTLNRDLD